MKNDRYYIRDLKYCDFENWLLIVIWCMEFGIFPKGILCSPLDEFKLISLNSPVIA